MLHELASNIHSGSGSVIENEFAFFVFTLLHLLVSLRVLQDFNFAVDCQMQTDLLVG